MIFLKSASFIGIHYKLTIVDEILKIIALTTKYNAKSDVKFKTNEIDNMKIIFEFLTIVNEIEKFLN